MKHLLESISAICIIKRIIWQLGNFSLVNKQLYSYADMANSYNYYLPIICGHTPIFSIIKVCYWTTMFTIILLSKNIAIEFYSNSEYGTETPCPHGSWNAENNILVLVMLEVNPGLWSEDCSSKGLTGYIWATWAIIYCCLIRNFCSRFLRRPQPFSPDSNLLASYNQKNEYSGKIRH
jgi:hypothetical protein